MTLVPNLGPKRALAFPRREQEAGVFEGGEMGLTNMREL